MKIEDFKLIPIRDITTPREGARVMVDRYWLTLNGNVLVYTRGGMFFSPQCHKDKRINDMALRKYKIKGLENIFIEISYWFDRQGEL